MPNFPALAFQRLERQFEFSAVDPRAEYRHPVFSGTARVSAFQVCVDAEQVGTAARFSDVKLPENRDAGATFQPAALHRYRDRADSCVGMDRVATRPAGESTFGLGSVCFDTAAAIAGSENAGILCDRRVCVCVALGSVGTLCASPSFGFRFFLGDVSRGFCCR